MAMNLGTPDRLLRILLGTLLLFVFLLVTTWPRWFGLLGIVPLVTASLGWCPLYQLLGIDSSPGGDERRPVREPPHEH